VPRRKSSKEPDVSRRPRWLWPVLALPGTVWMIIFFAVPFYGVMAIAGGRDNLLFNTRDPRWNPLEWHWDAFHTVWQGILNGDFGQPFIRTFEYVFFSLLICFIIGYPVAYYVARYGGKRRGLLLGLLLAPFWISYLMRMLAWVNLLQDDGYVNDALRALHIVHRPVDWLDGRPYTVVLGLVYGYVPFLILPLYASLDRIDVRLLEASRDLGVNPWRTFLKVTLPLSRQGILAGAAITALPMFGDYYTNTLLSASPRTNMIGNQIQNAVQTNSTRGIGAALVIVLTLLLTVLMFYYLYSSNAAAKELR
jgi:ABC-type spermidine/putrescine transport system permease subunit I